MLPSSFPSPLLASSPTFSTTSSRAVRQPFALGGVATGMAVGLAPAAAAAAQARPLRAAGSGVPSPDMLPYSSIRPLRPSSVRGAARLRKPGARAAFGSGETPHTVLIGRVRGLQAAPPRRPKLRRRRRALSTAAAAAESRGGSAARRASFALLTGHQQKHTRGHDVVYGAAATFCKYSR